MNLGLLSGSSELPRLLRRHGGTSRTNTSVVEEPKKEDNDNEPDEVFHPLLSLIDMQGQLSQFALESLQNGNDGCGFISLDRFNSIEKLPFDAFRDVGSGSTFSVKSFTPIWKYSYLDSNLNGVVVAKRIRPSSDPEILKSRLEAVKLEILTLTDPILAVQENIVDLLGIWWENSPIGGCPLPVLVLEQATFGTLIDLQRRPLTLRYFLKQRLCLDIAFGLEALHDASIVHGDLKSENVLIFKHLERGFIAKLSDFGSTIEGGHIARVLGKRKIIFTNEDVGMNSGVSVITFPWNAPEYEFHMKGVQLRSQDVYSFGLLVWRTMLDGRDPFETLSIPVEHDRYAAIEVVKRDENFADLILERLQATRITGELAKDIDIQSVNKVIRATVQFDPNKRSLPKAITSLGGEPSRVNLMRHQDQVIDMNNFLQAKESTRGEEKSKRKRLKPLIDSNLTIPTGLDIAVSNWAALIAKAGAAENPLSFCAEMYLKGSLSGTLRSIERDSTAILKTFSTAALKIKDAVLTETDIAQKKMDEQLMAGLRMEAIQMGRAMDQPLTMDIPIGEIIQEAASRGFGPALDILFNEALSLSHTDALRTWRDRYGGYPFEMPVDHNWDLRQPEELKMLLRQTVAGIQTNATRSSRFVHERLTRRQIDINKIWVSTDFKNNLLHYAVKSGARDIVEMLLSDFPFHIDCRNWLQETPLLVAMRSGHSDIANLLINMGADCSKRDLFQENALHWICRIDSPNIPDLIKRLLGAGCDINAISCKHPAAVLDDDESESWDFDILDSDTDSNLDQDSTDDIADDVRDFSNHQHEQLIRQSTTAGTPLHRAVVENNREAVINLCRFGCDTTIRSLINPQLKGPNTVQLNPFEVAAAVYRLDIMLAILPFYPKREPQDWIQVLILVISPLWTQSRMALHGSYCNSARQNTLEFCFTQLDRAYIREILPLATLVSTVDFTVLQEFLRRGLYPSLEETIEVLGWQLRPLEIALCDGKLDSLRVLLEAGAECNFLTLDSVGSTNCLHRLAHLGLDDSRFGELLLKYCNKSLLVDMPGGIMSGGTTPFVFAVTQGCFELAKLFLTNGADIDALAATQISDIFFTGMTALGRLAMQGCDTLLAQFEFLLDKEREKRADFIVAPATGFTAFHAAVLCHRERQSHPDTVVNLKFLLSVFNQQDDLDTVDRFGCSALHLAAIFGNYEAVQTLLAAGASWDIRLYHSLNIRPADIARLRAQNLVDSPLEEDLERGEHTMSHTLQRSMAIVDALTQAERCSTADTSSSKLQSGLPVHPLNENSYAMAQGFLIGILQFCDMWTITYGPEKIFIDRLVKAVEGSSKDWGIGNIEADTIAKYTGKGKSKAEDDDGGSFYYLPFWWMMIQWPSTGLRIQLAKNFQQEYGNRTVVRGKIVPVFTIVFKQDQMVEMRERKICLMGSIKTVIPEETSVIEKRCIALHTALLHTAAMLAQKPGSPPQNSEVGEDSFPSLSPELLEELERDGNVVYISVDSGDEGSEESAIGFMTETYSSSKQALHAALRSNRKTQRRIEKALGQYGVDELD